LAVKRWQNGSENSGKMAVKTAVKWSKNGRKWSKMGENGWEMVGKRSELVQENRRNWLRNG
jgi:hypothetical protein